MPLRAKPWRQESFVPSPLPGPPHPSSPHQAERPPLGGDPSKSWGFAERGQSCASPVARRRVCSALPSRGGAGTGSPQSHHVPQTPPAAAPCSAALAGAGWVHAPVLGVMGLPAKTLPGAGSTQSWGAAPPFFWAARCLLAGWGEGEGRRRCWRTQQRLQFVARRRLGCAIASTIREQPPHLEDFSAPASSRGPGRAQARPPPPCSFPPRFLLPHRRLRSVPRSTAALALHPTPRGHGTAPVPPGLPRSGSHARSQHRGIAPAPQEPRGGQEAAHPPGSCGHTGAAPGRQGRDVGGCARHPKLSTFLPGPLPPTPRAAGTAAAGPTK